MKPIEIFINLIIYYILLLCIVYNSTNIELYWYCIVLSQYLEVWYWNCIVDKNTVLLRPVFRAFLNCLAIFDNFHKYLIPFAYCFCSNNNSWTRAIYMGEGKGKGWPILSCMFQGMPSLTSRYPIMDFKTCHHGHQGIPSPTINFRWVLWSSSTTIYNTVCLFVCVFVCSFVHSFILSFVRSFV